MDRITVVGGGLAGLVAAIACAEEGHPVTLHEAHHTLGGRARTSSPPYVAHEGPHVFYADGEPWRWLFRRGLVQPAARLPLRAAAGIRFRHNGRLHRLPPEGLLRLASRRGLRAPVDRTFSDWATEHAGEDTARVAANLMGVVTFDADPGRLSAAFVWERLKRVTAFQAPAVRYVIGGWGTLITRMADRCRELGVDIETGARVDRLPARPVIVATDLTSASRLLGDDELHGTSGRTLLLDLGLRRGARDAFVVSDLDEAGFLERYSAPDPSLAPPGHELVQVHLPVRPGEPRADAVTRMERLCDLGLPGWRDRSAWRRDGIADGRTGALDLPGRTWRDRPAVDRGDGVFLAGDMVAAPGLLSEVAITSALQAARAATRHHGRASRGRVGAAMTSLAYPPARRVRAEKT